MRQPIYQAVVLPVLFITFFLSITLNTTYSQEEARGTGLTEAELEAFDIRIYTEVEKFPLENLTTLDGTLFDPRWIGGKYALVNLWATWCPNCATEKPILQGLYEQYKSESFTILAVSLGEDPVTVKDYMETKRYTIPVVLDTENRLRAAYAPRIPRTYVVDPQGNIIAAISGNKAWLSEERERILKYLVPVIR
jgi:thiol-disulfide isomerase/thioredoxin